MLTKLFFNYYLALSYIWNKLFTSGSGNLQKTTKLHLYFFVISFFFFLGYFLSFSVFFCLFLFLSLFPAFLSVAVCAPQLCVYLTRVELKSDVYPWGPLFLHCSAEVFSKYFVIRLHWWKIHRKTKGVSCTHLVQGWPTIWSSEYRYSLNH